MFYKIVSIFALFVILTSCGREQQMMKPVVQDMT